LVKLVGLSDYASTVEGEHVVILKIELAGTTDLYLTYNRATGVNSGTKEFQNKVTVVRGGTWFVDQHGHHRFGSSCSSR
jgi:hypothetical protein